jgi:hypothetical protein
MDLAIFILVALPQGRGWQCLFQYREIWGIREISPS